MQKDRDRDFSFWKRNTSRLDLSKNERREERKGEERVERTQRRQ